MLSKRDIQEMKAIAGRIQRGSVTREDWSTFAALTLIWTGDETVVTIAARGLDEFIRVSTPIYEGHAFQHDDYRRMYDRICAAATRYARDVVH
jgi:hypothetical protein